MPKIVVVVTRPGLSCQPSLIIAMADFPRWVPQSDVDSTAMLSAFLKYHKETSTALQEKHGMSYQPVWEGRLWCFRHSDPFGMSFARMQEIPMPLGIPQMPCQRRACSRCGVRGGFVFRWYSPYWAKHYNELRSPGAWKALEPAFSDSLVGEHYWLQHERFWCPTAGVL